MKNIKDNSLFLSVITINRNNAVGLKKTMETVLNQTSENFEYIIIDGASEDNSKQIIETFIDEHPNAKKISYWISETDGGIYQAINKGVAKAKGKYCHILNSGDWYVDNTIIERLEKLKRNEDIIYSDAYMVYKDRISVLKYPAKLDAFFFSQANTANHQNMIISTKLSQENPYIYEYTYCSDRVFLIETLICNNATSFHIPFIIAYYEASFGFSSINGKAMLEEAKKISDEYFPKRVAEDLKELYEYKYRWHGILEKLYNILDKYSSLKKKIFGR